METIFQQVLAFLGASAAGGITWDLLKGQGASLVDRFCKHFVARKYFKTEEDAKKFLKEISNEPARKFSKPLDYLRLLYVQYNEDGSAADFEQLFAQWVRENAGPLAEMGKAAQSGQVTVNGGIYVGQQNAENIYNTAGRLQP